jgi:hypothetical protein
MQASPTHRERAISLVLRFYGDPVFQPLVVEKSLYLSRAAPNFAAESAEPKGKSGTSFPQKKNPVRQKSYTSPDGCACDRTPWTQAHPGEIRC